MKGWIKAVGTGKKGLRDLNCDDEIMAFIHVLRKYCAPIQLVWTEMLCPPLQHVRHIPQQMGLRTMLNIVEKVINPVQSSNLIIGVCRFIRAVQCPVDS